MAFILCALLANYRVAALIVALFLIGEVLNHKIFPVERKWQVLGHLWEKDQTEPAEFVNQEDLKRKFNLASSTMGDILSDLETDGFIEIQMYKGNKVPYLTDLGIKELKRHTILYWVILRIIWGELKKKPTSP